MFIRYSSKSSKYAVTATLKDGRKVTVEFTGRDSITRDRFVDISDPLIIEALESHPSFDVNFSRQCQLSDDAEAIIPGEISLSGEKQDIKPEENKEPKGDKIKSFPTAKEARVWINTEHKVPYHKITNMDKLTHEFEQLGFELELKN